MVNRDEPRTGFEERAKKAFDDSVERVDGQTRSALTQARYAALEELKVGKRWTGARLLAPLTTVAAAAIVAVVMFRPAANDTLLGEGNAMALDDLDIVGDADNLEMLEDLDFYAWLDSADALPSG